MAGYGNSGGGNSGGGGLGGGGNKKGGSGGGGNKKGGGNGITTGGKPKKAFQYDPMRWTYYPASGANTPITGNPSPVPGDTKITTGSPLSGVGVTGGRRNSGPYNWLAPRSPASIAQQARETINKIYAPEYQDLNQQQKQAIGITEKRAADNRYYNSWLQTQMKALQSHTNAAQAQILGTENSLRAQQASTFQAQPGELVQGADQREGNVSNNAHSAAFGADLNANQQANIGLLNSAQQQATQGLATGNKQLAGARANDVAMIQNAESKRVADLNLALTTIANARAKLNTSKIGDTAKEIARLQGVEIQKAQSNRDYAAAAKKLGLDAANINSEINTRAGELKVAQTNATTALTRLQLEAMQSDRTYKLNVAKYNQATAKDIYERQHHLGPYRVAASSSSKSGGSSGGGSSGSSGGSSRGSSAGSKSLSSASTDSIFNHITRVRAAINQIEQFYLAQGYSESQAQTMAYHGVKNGYYYGAGGAYHHAPLTESSASILNAAYNTMSDRGGLSPGDIQYLESLGIPYSVIASQYNVSNAHGSGGH